MIYVVVTIKFEFKDSLDKCLVNVSVILKRQNTNYETCYVNHITSRAFQIKPNQLLYQQKRFRWKINTVKPRKTHYTKALVNKFLTPYYENPYKDTPLSEKCQLNAKQKEKKAVNPYEVIIARDVRNWFDNSAMIAFLHKNNMKGREVFELTVQLRQQNMYLKSYGGSILHLALEDSPYAAALPLMKWNCFVVFSPDIRIVQLQKILKKVPMVTLMAGIIHHRLLDIQNLIKYGTMNLVSAQTNMVQTLQNAGGNTLNQQLSHNQTTLVSRLQQIGKSETPSNKNESNESVPV